MILALGVARQAGEATMSPAPPAPENRRDTPGAQAPGGSRSYFGWIVISFGASLCLYAVNTYVATDVASFPLLWCLPLGVFLLSFAAGFSPRFAHARVWLIRLAQFAVLAALTQLVWVEDARTLWVGLLTPILALAILVA